MLTLKKLNFTLGFLFMVYISQNLFSLNFIAASDPKLNQTSSEIPIHEITSEEIQNLIHEMLVISGYESDPNQTGKEGVLVGIAAPQLGIMKQIIVVDPRSQMEIKANPGKAVFDILINPKITWESDELDFSREGCFSVPAQYMGAVKRPIAIEVEAYNREGKLFKKKYKNAAAFVVQHEIDHLKGIRFPMRVESEKHMHVLKNESEIAKYRIECSSCSRRISTKYSEIRETIITCYYMCDDCPRLDTFLVQENEMDYSSASGLVCGHCGTSSLDLKRGELLGCPDCYETFDSLISKELEEFSSHEPPQIQHIGHKPGELKEMSPNLKILALNEALVKTLNEENYEQAAWIRDQITELKKKANKS